MEGWKEQTIGIFKPKTVYRLAKDNERSFLAAHSAKSASGMLYKLKLDPKEYPLLKWSWKVDHTIAKGDERTKEGDDFSARIYVLFPRGIFSETRAICYVWANKLTKGEHVASPFTKNIITVAVDSGDEAIGRWISHQRNVYQDYRKFFGEEPPRIGAVALMTDTDNTGESTAGYYGDISFLRPAKPDETKNKESIPREPQQKPVDPAEQRSRETKGHATPFPSPAIPEGSVSPLSRP
ncbi:DUF3047 domain-containing protein [Geobacter sp. SVR]|uniref:DUF3047 domain-containing protein n=1 Tax=Geobacter sp. SVR TaxID=2495594 RepID=UPI001EF254E5|nr:DUF3047 domain-containing protein [Geobacter sp. SVR]